MFFRAFVGVPVGIILWYITRLVLNWLALGSAELVHALLGQDEVGVLAQSSRMQIPMALAQYEK